MLTLKIDAQRLAAPCRTRALLFAFLSILSGAACAACGILLLSCLLTGPEHILSLILPSSASDRIPWFLPVLPVLFALLLILFSLCEASYAQVYHAMFYAAAAGEAGSFRQQLSFRNGLRLIGYRCMRCFFLCRDFLKCFAPIMIGLTLDGGLLCLTGIPKALFPLSLILPAIQLPLCCAAFYVNRRKYVLAPYLMYLYPRLAAKDALISSILLTEGKRSRITVCWLRLSGWRLFSFLILPLPFTLWYLPAVETALSARIYKEHCASPMLLSKPILRRDAQ